ncbi:RNA-directed DNA polymerase, eukaryota [Tanacetum coccineum]
MAARNRSNFDHTRLISKSIFVTNFPDNTSAKYLWEVCKGYGTVVDVFIPNRKSRSGKRFAFVRFIKVGNVDHLVENLCTLWIGRMHLHANVVRYDRPPISSSRPNVAPRPTVKFVSRPSANGASSFVSVLKGNPNTINHISTSPAMVLDDECLVERDLDNFVLGEVKDFSSINNLLILLLNEGFQHVRLVYLGGLWVMIELPSIETKTRFMKHVGVASWFSQLRTAQSNFVSRERILASPEQTATVHHGLLPFLEVSFQDAQTDCVQDTAQRKKFKRLKASTAFKTKQTDAEQRRPTIKKLEVKQVEFKLGEDCWEIQVKRNIDPTYWVAGVVIVFEVRGSSISDTKKKEIRKPETEELKWGLRRVHLGAEMGDEVEDSDPEQAQRDKDMQKNLALFAKYFKKLYKYGESMESYYSRFYKLMNELTRNNLQVTTMQVNVQFLQQLQPEWSRFVTVVKQSKEIDTISYHTLFDILKQYQNEVNDIRAERIAKSANPLALLAAAQPYLDNYYQAPKPQRSNVTSSSTRPSASTRHKGKEIAKPVTPQSGSVSEEDNDPEQTQRDKDMQKNLALFAKYFKKLYKYGESMESYYSRFYKLMNELTRNNLQVTTMQVNVQFLQQLQPEWSRFVTVVKQSKEIDTISYHTLFDILKQYQNEVNDIRAERIAKSANPLALLAAAQPYSDNYYQAPKPQRSNATSSSTRPSASTRHKGKEIAKPVTPQSESVSEEDSDPEQAQRDKDMQKNLALLAKYFKRLYKPTNNNLRTSSNSRNKTEDTTPRYNNDNQSGQFGNQRTMTVAGLGKTVGSQ